MSLNPYSDTVQCPVTGWIHLLFPHMQSRLVPHSSISIHLFTHRPLCRPLSAAFQRAQLSRAQGSFLVRYDAGSEWGHYASPLPRPQSVVAAPPIKMQTSPLAPRSRPQIAVIFLVKLPSHKHHCTGDLRYPRQILYCFAI